MDILIGATLLFAIILLGALLSAASERQRRALDGIREQVEAWAEEDILIKREKVARSIQIESPLGWLEKTAAHALGQMPGILSIGLWEKDGLLAVIAIRRDGGRLIFTPASRDRFLAGVKLKKRGALAQVETGPLGDRPAKIAHHELSVVTGGMFFDIEADQVWQALTGQSLPARRLTMFEIPPRPGAKVS